MRRPLSIFSFSSREPLAGIALFLLGVILIEATLGFALPDNHMVRRFRWAMERATTTEAPNLQIMGDSGAYCGLIEAAFAPLVGEGGTVRKDAIAATGPEFAYFFLRRELAAGRVPDAILYAPSPHTFASSRVPIFVGACARAGESWEIAWSGAAASEVAFAGMCRGSYTLRYREHLREFLTGNREVVREFTKSASSEQVGWGLPPVIQEGASSRFPEAGMPEMYRQPFAVTESNRHFLEGLFGLCREHGIPVYWATLPVLPVVAESRSRVGYLDAYREFLSELEARYGVIVVRRDYPVFGEEEFFDYTHLTEAGAERNSAEIAARLREAWQP